MTDTQLIPNKTLKSLILNKSTEKLEQLAATYLEMKAENIAGMREGAKPAEILAILKQIDGFMKELKAGTIPIPSALDKLARYCSLIPEDDEFLQDFLLLAYYQNDYKRGKLVLDILGKNPLFDVVNLLMEVIELASAKKLEDAKKKYAEIEKSREANLFRVRDLKYKAIACEAIGDYNEAIKLFDAYEVFIPFDPSVYPLFKARALKKDSRMAELQKYQLEYFIKYGAFAELEKI